MSQSLPVLRDAALTEPAFCRRLNFPNLTRRNRSLLPVPSWRTMTAFFVSCHQCILFSGCGYILARQRPGVREAPAVRKTGERCLAFFVFNPNLTRCLMSRLLEQLTPIEMKVRLAAELIEIVSNGKVANVDGVSLVMAEAADALTALVDDLRALEAAHA